jgi:hypothetical protein
VSNSLFPSTTVQQWGITWPIKKSPGFKTLVQTPANNIGELRISLTQYPIWVWELDVDYLKGDMSAAESGSALQEVLGFFGSMQGAASDWLYQDPYDNSCVGQSLGVADGVASTFQLVRNTNGMIDLMQTALPTAVYWNGTPIQAGPAASGDQWYCGIENLLLQSSAFNNSVWIKENGGGASAPTVTANTQTAPDGTMTADTIVFGAVSSTSQWSYLEQQVNVPYLGQQFTFSIWLKAASPVTVYTDFNAEGNVAFSTSFAVTTSWQRFQVTGTFSAVDPLSTGAFLALGLFNIASSAAVTVYAWGAQVERWPSATSYTATLTVPIVTNGIIFFSSTGVPGANVPPADTVVTADFNFWYRCRFLDDQWTELEEGLYRIWNLHKLSFKSLLI